MNGVLVEEVRRVSLLTSYLLGGTVFCPLIGTPGLLTLVFSGILLSLPPRVCRCNFHFWLLQGFSGSRLKFSHFSSRHFTYCPVSSASWALQSDLVTRCLCLKEFRRVLSTGCQRREHRKSLISIAVLSLSQSMCPEEAEILHRLESDWRTVNRHRARVRQVNCN